MLLPQHLAINCALLEGSADLMMDKKKLAAKFAEKKSRSVVVQRVWTVGRLDEGGSSKIKKKKKNFISWLSQSVINDPC